MIITLIIDKSSPVGSLSNYRAITLIPVISKLSEGVLLNIANNLLISDDLQFGLKRIAAAPMYSIRLGQLLTILMLMVVLCKLLHSTLAKLLMSLTTSSFFLFDTYWYLTMYH